MIWVVAAIGAAAILGVVSILDSHLISRRMPSLSSFLAPVGMIHLVFGLIVLVLYPLPGGTGATPLIVAFASGIVRSLGVVLMLQVMRSEEVSRIMPVVHTFPIFVAILAVPFLGETLDYIKWLGIIITVAGAVLISVRRDAVGERVWFRKSFVLLIGSSLLLGIANTASKYALGYISFWNMYSVNAICFSLVFLLSSLRPRVLREIRGITERGRVLGLLVVNEGIALVGIVLSFWAMERGAVSLVSTITSIRPFFVFVYAVVLSHLWPSVLEEHFSRGVIAVKIISIGLVVGGVTLITLSI